MTVQHVLRKVFRISPRLPEAGREEGVRWYLLPAAEGRFSHREIPQLMSRGTVIKTGAQRTIVRVELPTGPIYLKQIRVHSPRAWAREMLRPSKARLEFENALLLRERGIPSIEPLALGEADSAWPGTSYLITRGADHAVPLDHFLSTTPLTMTLRCQLATEFGRFLARMHQAGVLHPDPHPGNFLLHLDPQTSTPQFSLLDLHSVVFRRRLSASEIRSNLILINRWFSLRANRTDRARFWKAYQASDPSGITRLPAREQARSLERETLQSNLKFWQRRNSRFLGASRFFARQKTPQSRFIAVHEFLPQVLPYLGNPQTLLDVPPEQVLKDSRSSRVVRRMLAGKPVIVKLFKTRSRWGRIKNLLRSSPARRSWLLGCQLLDRGLATARPLAYFQSAKNGIPGDGIVLTEEIPEALDLAAALRDPTLAEFAPLWRDRLARLIRLLHERGVSHRDLKAPNILLPCPRSAPALAEPILVDLVGVRVARHVPRRTRVRDLARLNLSASVLPILRQTDRLRFLLTYLNRQTRRDRSWKAWWREIAQATQVKQLQNQHRGRPIA